MPAEQASPTINPSDYASWPRERHLRDIMSRGTLHEAVAMQLAVSQGIDPAPLYENALSDLRQTLMHIGNDWDLGVSRASVQNAEQTGLLDIRVRGSFCGISLY